MASESKAAHAMVTEWRNSGTKNEQQNLLLTSKQWNQSSCQLSILLQLQVSITRHLEMNIKSNKVSKIDVYSTEWVSTWEKETERELSRWSVEDKRKEERDKSCRVAQRIIFVFYFLQTRYPIFSLSWQNRSLFKVSCTAEETPLFLS